MRLTTFTSIIPIVCDLLRSPSRYGSPAVPRRIVPRHEQNSPPERPAAGSEEQGDSTSPQDLLHCSSGTSQPPSRQPSPWPWMTSPVESCDWELGTTDETSRFRRAPTAAKWALSSLVG
ncbi:hypothetical protein I7I51_07559 [Histoplasma capsulatum]|uniref:Uncharacterized protein n=1 Tax=Ajellomyces capsulatus TaxID=5037 RepID=A0A8A1LVH1_AJECA|nr:hypothetical protein I7I51_07559 [Histoplasma capsulatum]